MHFFLLSAQAEEKTCFAIFFFYTCSESFVRFMHDFVLSIDDWSLFRACLRHMSLNLVLFLVTTVSAARMKARTLHPKVPISFFLVLIGGSLRIMMSKPLMNEVQPRKLLCKSPLSISILQLIYTSLCLFVF